jgi:hypothetical protein
MDCIVIEVIHGARPLVEGAKVRFLVDGERPPPRAAGESQGIGKMTRLRQRLSALDLVEVRAQRLDVGPYRRRQRCDVGRTEVLDLVALQLQAEVIRHDQRRRPCSR